MTIWIKTAEQPPVDTSLILRRWSNGNVWAGPHEAGPKNQGFAEYIDVPVLERQYAELTTMLSRIKQLIDEASAEPDTPTLAAVRRLLAKKELS